MASPFDTWTYRHLKALVEAPANYAVLFKYVSERDHWQNGTGFIGPTTSTTAEASEAQIRAIGLAATVVQNALHKSFTSEALINEVVDRRVKALCGSLPRWHWKLRRTLKEGEDPSEEEQAELTARNEALRDWWDSPQHDLVNTVFKAIVAAVSAYERVVLRIRVPSYRLDANGRLKYPVESVADALQHVFVEVVLPDAGVVYTDDESLFDVGVVEFKGPQEGPDAQAGDATTLEVCYVDPDDGMTIVRTIASDDKEDEVSYELGGAMLHYQVEERDPFLSQQIIEQQQATNTASTEMRIVNDDAGFQLRLILNALPPGQMQQITLDDGSKEDAFVPLTDLTLQPGSQVWVQGLEVEDDDGNIRDYKTPSIDTFPPSPATPYLAEMAARRRSVLNECHQLFVETIDDASSSGDSRLMALSDFLEDIAELKSFIDPAMRFALETAYTLALWLSGGTVSDAYQVSFESRMELPYLPANLVDALVKLRNEGLRSTERVMAETGVDDVAAEMNAIEASQAHQIKLRTQAVEFVQSLIDLGIEREQAVEYALEQFPILDGLDELDFTEVPADLDAEDTPSHNDPAPVDDEVPVDRPGLLAA